MKKLLMSLVFFTAVFAVTAQNDWPREIKANGKIITIYQPQTDSMKGDHLYSRMAFSIKAQNSQDYTFGALWTDSRFSTDRSSGMCTIFDIKVMNIRFPGADTVEKKKMDQYKAFLEKEAKSWNIEFSLEELKSSLELSKTAKGTAENLKNDPPEIIFLKTRSVLVLFDGDPVWKDSGIEGVKRGVNTPYLALQDTKEKSFYLFGGIYWFKSADLLNKPFTNVKKPSSSVQKYFNALKKEMEKSGKKAEITDEDSKSKTPPVVIVRTKPAELIQSDGEPQFAPIQGTSLLYITNTEDNIFMTTNKNSYYVLLSGRWYTAEVLSGPWKFIESASLPEDFKKIPEGSPKDVVLASVAGTDAAREAVLDAQIPQTAAVDRKTAKCTVKWDGDPKFEKVKGTEISRGMNTSSTVLLYKNTYYVCDNAIWFTGKSPSGPWEVATSVPDEFQKIPADDPAYNVKYVYIYDVEPEVVYVGYTPGYTGCYVYGPTVVYGTGWPYPPFYGPNYYPHPVTFGFSMHYNPWYGFSMGFSVSYGMFSFSFGGPMGYPGGCWGPPLYRPPYAMPYSHHYGSVPPAYRGGGNTINVDNSRNIYNDRADRSARPSTQPADKRGNRGGTGVSQQPANNRGGDRGASASQQPARGDRQSGDRVSNDKAGNKNNVYTDRDGNVYRNNNGDWQKNNGKDWESANRTSASDRSGQQRQQQDLNRQNQSRQRGSQNSYNRSSAQSYGGGGRSYGGGGGARMGGGGGGRRR